MNLYLIAGLVVIGGAVSILMMSNAGGTDDVVKKPEKRFPKVTAENLERRKFNLPEDFEGELTRFYEAVKIALDSIRANFTRSALTILGIVVGIGVVVGVAALLEGAQNFIVSATAEFAPDVLRIEKAAFQDFGFDGQEFVEAQSKRPDILSEDLDFLRERLGGEFEVGAQTDASLPARRVGKTLVGVAVQGVTPNITELSNVRIAFGRGLTETDENFRRSVCVIGQDLVGELFGAANPIGEEIRLGQLPFEVVGVAQPRGSLFGNSQDGFVQIPLETFQRIFGTRSRSLAILAKARDTKKIPADEAEEQVRVATQIFEDENPIGETVKIDGKLFRVVGVLRKASGEGVIGSDELDERAVYIPFETAQKNYPEIKENIITVRTPPGKIDETTEDVTNLLRQRRGVPSDQPNNFGVNRAEQIFALVGDIISGLSLIIVPIALAGLLVGGVGVMNIMLVSVKERAAEIGIRRALGATQKTILIQFLLEAMMLTGSGGIIGILAGLTLALAVRIIVSFPAVVPFWAILAGFGASISIGLIAGIYPAFRAARRDPVEAMRGN